MQSIQFISVTPEQLQSEISNGVKVILDKFLEHYKPVQPAEYLTRKQVAEMFNVDISSVHNWTKRGILKSFGIGGRVYFLRSDIEACLIPLNK